MLNKKGQIGETLTWVVATVIIVATLMSFIYVSSLLAKVKSISVPDLKLDSEEDIDLLKVKTSFAYLLSQNKNKERIDDWVNWGETNE